MHFRFPSSASSSSTPSRPSRSRKSSASTPDPHDRNHNHTHNHGAPTTPRMSPSASAPNTPPSTTKGKPHLEGVKKLVKKVRHRLSSLGHRDHNHHPDHKRSRTLSQSSLANSFEHSIAAAAATLTPFAIQVPPSPARTRTPSGFDEHASTRSLRSARSSGFSSDTKVSEYSSSRKATISFSDYGSMRGLSLRKEKVADEQQRPLSGQKVHEIVPLDVRDIFNPEEVIDIAPERTSSHDLSPADIPLPESPNATPASSADDLPNLYTVASAQPELTPSPADIPLPASAQVSPAASLKDLSSGVLEETSFAAGIPRPESPVASVEDLNAPAVRVQDNVPTVPNTDVAAASSVQDIPEAIAFSTVSSGPMTVVELSPISEEPTSPETESTSLAVALEVASSPPIHVSPSTSLSREDKESEAVKEVSEEPSLLADYVEPQMQPTETVIPVVSVTKKTRHMSDKGVQSEPVLPFTDASRLPTPTPSQRTHSVYISESPFANASHTLYPSSYLVPSTTSPSSKPATSLPTPTPTQASLPTHTEQRISPKQQQQLFLNIIFPSIFRPFSSVRLSISNSKSSYSLYPSLLTWYLKRTVV